MEWKKPAAIIMLLTAALLTGISASTAPQANGIQYASTDADLEADIIEAEIFVESGTFQMRVPTLLRVGASYGEFGPEDLTATVNVYELPRDSPCGWDHVDPIPVYSSNDGFTGHVLQVTTTPNSAEAIEMCGDGHVFWVVWQLSGASNLVRDAQIRQMESAHIGGAIVALDQRQKSAHVWLVALATTTTSASIVFALLPTRRPQLPILGGAMGGGVALAEHGTHWLRGLRNAYIIVADLLVVALGLFAWLVVTATSNLVGTSWNSAGAHPFNGWQIWVLGLVVAICAAGAFLGMRELILAHRRLKRWESAVSPIEGELE